METIEHRNLANMQPSLSGKYHDQQSFFTCRLYQQNQADITGIGGRRHGGNGSDAVRRKSCRPEACSMYVGGRKAQRRAADGTFSDMPVAYRKTKAL